MAIVNHIACHKTFYLKEIRPTPSKIILAYFTWPYRETGGRGDGGTGRILNIYRSTRATNYLQLNLKI